MKPYLIPEAECRSLEHPGQAKMCDGNISWLDKEQRNGGHAWERKI